MPAASKTLRRALPSSKGRVSTTITSNRTPLSQAARRVPSTTERAGESHDYVAVFDFASGLRADDLGGINDTVSYKVVDSFQKVLLCFVLSQVCTDNGNFILEIADSYTLRRAHRSRIYKMTYLSGNDLQQVTVGSIPREV